MSPHDPGHDDPGLDDAAPAWVLEAVLTAIADADAEAPPPELRASVLTAAGARPRQTVEPVGPVELYRLRVAALRALLQTLAADEWAVAAAPYDWTVHGLVAHLLQIERYTLRVIIDGCDADGLDADLDDHLAVGADAIAAEVGRDPAETVAAWVGASAEVLDFVASPGCDLTSPAPLHGWPFTRSAALVARAFEVWTHTEDIWRATGRPVELPSPAELRAMSSASVGALPLLIQLRRPGQPLPPTRIVLTGSGGGTYDIGPSDATTTPGEGEALIAADVVDYCRVVARRLPVADMSAVRLGDRELIDDLLAAAGAIAM